tara:strand:- start:111 stop:479 length:369 start_codon:yes stop_codon:yes gene_type:complete
MSRNIKLNQLFKALFVILVLVSCGGVAEKTSTPSIDLLTAIDKNNVEIVKQHIVSGTNINDYPIPKGLPFEGAQPLHLAVLKSDSEIVELLLDNRADINVKANNKDAATPLHWAVFFLQREW